MRAAVLGSPIAHSLSPALHRAAYAALGLPWSYDAVEVLPDDLPRFLSVLGPDWVGLSLTMPLKQTVLPLLDEITPLARATGAANTVLLAGGRRTGDNTDVAGIAAALAEVGVTAVGRSAVLGGGATAASALAALAALGDRSPWVLVRSPHRTGPLREAAKRLGVTPQIVPFGFELPPLDAVVSTVPGGRLDLRLSCPLLDVAYDPWPTPLATGWHGPVVGGAVMLLHQAAGQVALMTGRPAPLAAMRAALDPQLLSRLGGSPPM
ncbi:MAG: Shikimate dehydrogenase substrate binding domain protein [Frankiales bacterium]|nr:Shikimate dehydrogenase substrate binding domain protein [Frankiales bacterium]